MWQLYILRSLKDDQGYVGTTSDLSARLKQHNTGKVRSTKHRRPFVLVHTENFHTLSEARKREWFYKCTPQGGKLKRDILNRSRGGGPKGA